MENITYKVHTYTMYDAQRIDISHCRIKNNNCQKVRFGPCLDVLLIFSVRLPVHAERLDAGEQ